MAATTPLAPSPPGTGTTQAPLTPAERQALLRPIAPPSPWMVVALVAFAGLVA